MKFANIFQPSAINSNSLLPEEIAKEMKTEDQILAQLRATQNMGPPPSQPFMNELQGSAPPTASAEDCFPPNVSATPNLEELHKLIQKETLTGQAPVNNVPEPEIVEQQVNILFNHVFYTGIFFSIITFFCNDQ